MLSMSCLPTNSQNDTTTVSEYSEEGDLLSTKEIMQDSTVHGKYIEFYKGGAVKSIISYELGEKNGEALFYSESGTLMMKESWSNDIQQDTTWWYYPDGRIRCKINFNNGYKAGAGLCYHGDGDLLAYIYYGDEGEVIFRQDYAQGEIIDTKGAGFVSLDFSSTEVSIDNALQIDIIPVNPPDCRTQVCINILNNDHRVEATHCEEGSSSIQFSYLFTHPGKYEVISSIQISRYDRVQWGDEFIMPIVVLE